jgi:hypothetical protein
MKYEISCASCFWCRAKSGSVDYVCTKQSWVNWAFDNENIACVSGDEWKCEKKVKNQKSQMVNPVIHLESICNDYLPENEAVLDRGQIKWKGQKNPKPTDEKQSDKPVKNGSFKKLFGGK